ncbi:hypothetical protein [Flagellimonas sp.]|jgi:hypothetical protein|uniref:hypothetical protein n=1 Tax=Flagellimonas sp. TaxID=2058762 RepID=UPI003BA95A33
MSKALKFISSNWLNLLVLIIVLAVESLSGDMRQIEFNDLLENFITSGFSFLMLVLALVLVVEFSLIGFLAFRKVKIVLALTFFILSLPFFYWIIFSPGGNNSINLIAIFLYFVVQMKRYKKCSRIINETT